MKKKIIIKKFGYLFFLYLFYNGILYITYYVPVPGKIPYMRITWFLRHRTKKSASQIVEFSKQHKL